MARVKDQFNISDMLFNILVNLIYNTLTATTGAPALGIPTAVFTDYLALLTPWNDIYAITKVKSGATPTNRVTRDDAKTALTDFLRDFVKKWLYDNMPPCTNTIITSVGLKPHATTRTDHSAVPTIKPVFTAVPNENHGFKCKILDTSGKAAKPTGVSIMRIRYFVGAGAPVDPSKFTSFKDFSKNPAELPLSADQAGQAIAMAACYVNASGEEGPYSTVIVTTIP